MQHLIYITRKSLEIYNTNSTGSIAKLEFNPEVYSDEEIKNLESFKKLTGDFLKNNLKNNKEIIIVISDQLVFQKVIIGAKSEDLKTESEIFFKSVPFDPQKIVKKTITLKNETNFIAVNRNVYEELIKLLTNFQIKTKAVLPANFLIAPNTNILSDKDVKTLLNTSLREKIDLLKGEISHGIQSVDTFQTEPKNKSKRLVILILFFVLLVASLCIMLATRTNLTGNTPKSNEKPIVQENQTVEPQQSTASADRVNTNYKIQILNGTGTTGTAQRIRAKLEALKFNDVTIGNTPSLSDATKVNFSNTVDVQTQNTINNLLSESFSDIKIGKIEANSKFDIEIVTGKSK